MQQYEGLVALNIEMATTEAVARSECIRVDCTNALVVERPTAPKFPLGQLHFGRAVDTAKATGTRLVGW